jgi:hypothetical protein
MGSKYGHDPGEGDDVRLLSRSEGVSEARVDFDAETATVECEPGKAVPEKLMEVIGSVGYGMDLREITRGGDGFDAERSRGCAGGGG